MLYSSSRGKSESVKFLEELTSGVAPDGGLYLPEKTPKFLEEELLSFKNFSYNELALKILHPFMDDFLSEEELEKILEWSERLEILELALYDEAGGQRTEFAINQLRMMQQFSQSPGLTPLSSETEDGMADVLTFAQALFGGMSDARDGFASDIEHEKN